MVEWFNFLPWRWRGLSRNERSWLLLHAHLLIDRLLFASSGFAIGYLCAYVTL